MDACKRFTTTYEGEIDSKILKMSNDKTMSTQRSITPLWIQHPTCTQVNFMNENTHKKINNPFVHHGRHAL